MADFEDQADQVVAQHFHERGAEQRCDRLVAEARHERLGHQVGDVVVAHVAEPGCAVREAVATDVMSRGRYESYVKLREEIVEGTPPEWA